MHKNLIFFRADGGYLIGLGHIYRCIALIEILSEKFRCIFILVKPDKKVKDIVESKCEILLINADNISEELVKLKHLLPTGSILVLDGYEFDLNYQTKVKALKNIKLVCIDDNKGGEFFSDVVINHGEISAIPPYNLNGDAILCDGYKYLMLRREFVDAVKVYRREIQKVRSTIICIGGTDPYNISEKLLHACNNSNFFEEIHLIYGGNKNVEDWLVSCEKSICAVQSKITFHKDLSSQEIVKLIRATELLFCTASTIALEAACVKTGLICGMVVDNQRAIYDQLVNSGCCIGIGRWQDITQKEITKLILDVCLPSRINHLIKFQEANIDGNSKERLMSVFVRLINI